MNLPAEGYLRLEGIIGNPKKNTPAIIPVSRSTWWQGVASGRYPPAIKLSPRVTVWKVEDIRAFIEESNNGGSTHE